MDLTTQEVSGVMVAKVAGRLDAASASQFEKASEGWIAAGTKRLVLDLGALEYISSAGLRAVLSTMKRLKAAGGSLAVCGLGGVVKDVFAISGFDTLLPVASTVAEATARL